MSPAPETTCITRIATATLLFGLVVAYIAGYFGTVRVGGGRISGHTYSHDPEYSFADSIASRFFSPIHLLDRKLLRRARWNGDIRVRWRDLKIYGPREEQRSTMWQAARPPVAAL